MKVLVGSGDRVGVEHAVNRIEAWVALALCGAVLVAALVQRLVPGRPAYAEVFAPDWIALPAAVLAGLAAAATLRGDHDHDRPPSPARRVLDWSACLLMTWASGGLLLDVFRVVGLIPLGVDAPGMATRALALAATIVLTRLTLFRPPHGSRGPVQAGSAGPPSCSRCPTRCSRRGGPWGARSGSPGRASLAS